MRPSAAARPRAPQQLHSLSVTALFFRGDSARRQNRATPSRRSPQALPVRHPAAEHRGATGLGDRDRDRGGTALPGFPAGVRLLSVMHLRQAPPDSYGLPPRPQTPLWRVAQDKPPRADRIPCNTYDRRSYSQCALAPQTGVAHALPSLAIHCTSTGLIRFILVAYRYSEVSHRIQRY